MTYLIRSIGKVFASLKHGRTSYLRMPNVYQYFNIRAMLSTFTVHSWYTIQMIMNKQRENKNVSKKHLVWTLSMYSTSVVRLSRSDIELGTTSYKEITLTQHALHKNASAFIYVSIKFVVSNEMCRCIICSKTIILKPFKFTLALLCL